MEMTKKSVIDKLKDRFGFDDDEAEMYNRIANMKISDFTDEDDEVDDDYIEDDIPFVCKTCGGPYPSCETSCKMFDD